MLASSKRNGLHAAMRLGDLFGVAFLLTAGLFLGLPRYNSNLDFSDEGLLAYGGVRVMEGQMPNRDFVSLQGPLSFYVVAAVFKVLGTSLVSLRIFGLGIYILVCLLVYSLARSFVGPICSGAAGLVPTVLGISYFNFIPYAVWQGIVANLAAGLLYLRASGGVGPGQSAGRSRLLALLAGVFTGLSVLLRQDEAVYLATAIIAYTIVLMVLRQQGAEKQLLCWLLGMTFILAPFGLWWWARGALHGFIEQQFLFPFTTYVKTSSRPFPPINSAATLAEKAIALSFYVPPAIELGMMAWVGRRALRRQFGRREAGIMFILIWALLFYLQVLTRSDPPHLLTTLPPFLVLCACGCGLLADIAFRGAGDGAASGPGFRLGSRLSLAVIFVTGFGFLLLVKPYFVRRPLPVGETLEVKRAGVRKLGASNIKKFVETVSFYAPPDRPILCLPYVPIFYFLCERRNPTRWNYLWPGDQTAADHRVLIEQAKTDPPAVVIITDEADMRRFASDVLDYVHEYYRPGPSYGGRFVIYLPRATSD